MKYNPNLDSVRAFAALSVIAMHYQTLLFGWIGVQFFFVLSGFLISGIVLNAKEKYKDQKASDFFKNFYIRRMLRLFPLYYGYIIIISIIYLFTKRPTVFGDEWPTLFTYTLNFSWLSRNFIFSPSFGHLWSLAIEWQFYLVWPTFLWWVSSKNVHRILLWLIPLAIILRIIGAIVCMNIPGCVSYQGAPDDIALSAYVLPSSQIDAFVFGALLCNMQIRRFLAKPIIFLSSFLLALVIGLILVAYLPSKDYNLNSLGWPIRMPLAYQWIWGYTLLNIISASVIAGIVEEKRIWLSITKFRFLRYLGTISYGIYVYHLVIVFFVFAIMKKLPTFFGSEWVGFMLATILSVIVAHFSYNLWEKRFTNLKYRFKEPKPVLKKENF